MELFKEEYQSVHEANVVVPSYFDCKHLNDLAHDWRCGIKDILAECRRLRRCMEKATTSHERKRFETRMKWQYQSLRFAIKCYRRTQSRSIEFKNLYIGQFSANQDV